MISFTEDGLDRVLFMLQSSINAGSPHAYATRAMKQAADAIEYLRRERVPPTSEETAWLHKFISCVPFGADAPAADIKRAHDIVERQSRRIAELERTLAEPDCLWYQRNCALEKKSAELQRALEEAKRDAVRYRYIRSRGQADPFGAQIRIANCPDEFDTAIDAALALATAQPSEGCNG